MQSAVRLTAVTKRFRVAQRRPGLLGALGHVLSPRYVEKEAVRGIHLDVQPGERVAVLGANGAGKSTTLKLMMGLYPPSEGTVEVLGLEPHRALSTVCRRMGAVFGQRTQLWWDIPVIESLKVLGDLFGLPARERDARIAALVEDFELAELIHVPVRQLSLGQRMRCDVAASLLHRPEVLFLDEPTLGLDLAAKEKIRERLRAALASGTTLLLTSHDLSDVLDLCERVVLLDAGQVVFDGRLEEVAQTVGAQRTAHFELDAPAPEGFAVELPSAQVVQREGTRLSIRFDARVVSVAELLRHALASLPVRDVRVEQPGLESVVRRLYTGQRPVPVEDAA